MTEIVETEIVTPRDASTLIVIRDRDTVPKVLMGQRGENASFFPSRFVFPGGSVDYVDHSVGLAEPINALCHGRLSQHEGDTALTDALVAAAIRELWEETGLLLGTDGHWDVPPPTGWESYAAQGVRPTGAGVSYLFRAITPVSLPKRFDARFFMADAADLRNDPDDFSGADAELSHLQWIPLSEARSFELPHITNVVLDDVDEAIRRTGPAESIRFFYNAPGIREYRAIV